MLDTIWLACLLSIASFVGVANGSEILNTFAHEGVDREYLLYVPPSYSADSADAAMPLLVALHGRPGNAARMVELTQFNKRAEAHGFLVVYPQGLNQYWNYLHGLANNRSIPNDPDFILRVVSHVKAAYNIDERRVYVTGISNGGFMAQRLACHKPDLFAAFASVAASGYAYMPSECDTHDAVNMLYIHGTADGRVPWKGLSIPGDNGTQRPVTMSITDSLKYWSTRARCSVNVSRDKIASWQNNAPTHVVRFASRECANSAEVVLYAVMGGGHNWPGVEGVIPPRIAGSVNTDIHASDVIWSFFSNKQRH